MTEQLTKFKEDLEELKQMKARIQVKLEESVTRGKSLKETLSQMGYSSLSEARSDYNKMCSDFEKKRDEVLKLIQNIKDVEGKVPTKEEILERLRSELNSVSLEKEEVIKEEVSEKENEIKQETPQPVEDTSNKESDTNSTDEFDLNGLLFGGL